MPKGETEQHLKNEAEIIAFILAKFPTLYHGYIKLDRLGYNLDGVLCKRRDEYGWLDARFFCEVKDRNYPFKKYPDFIVSASKLVEGQRLTKGNGLHSGLIARFSDGVIASVRFDRHEGEFRIGGRYDRPDFPNDVERVAVFAWDRFTVLT